MSKENILGLPIQEYKGGKSTLCAGCGHDSITDKIIKACFNNGIKPHMVAKMSGIGCSSKTPAYFLSKSHGFNTVHGRMPSVSTGAALANRKLTVLGVSGDGDTASIGIGQFVHCVRRNAPMVYIVENNGVYGLTKGQFSATADEGSKSKKGVPNEIPPIDLTSLAIQLGCGFVGKSFSGAPKQLTPLIQAALSYQGTAVIDVISPCVTFNNHEGSTRSYNYVKDHDIELQTLDYIPSFTPIDEIDIPQGESTDVEMHDGSTIRLTGTKEDYDVHNRNAAIGAINDSMAKGEHLTGLLYLDNSKKNIYQEMRLCETPLASLEEETTRPTEETLTEIMNSYK
tara:strand:- start:3582 stop:4604 length:1023 start_codon:yes stop_codon:yes gene_type:complete